MSFILPDKILKQHIRIDAQQGQAVMTVSLLLFAILPPLLLARYIYGLNTHGRLDVGSCVRLLIFFWWAGRHTDTNGWHHS